MKMQKLVATVALAGALTAGTAGIAYAADSGTSGSGSPAATATRHPRLRLLVRRHVTTIVSETLGVSKDDLRAAIKGGQSITDYANSLGKDPQTVTDALVNAANGFIDKLVSNGRIDGTKGAELKTKVPERVEKLMNRHFGQPAA